MSVSGRFREFAGVPVVLLLIIFSLLLGSPASAALVIANESFFPDPPLLVDDGQHAVITIAIIPAGAMTFSRTHTLQMQTDLANARWNILVFVNGIPAAQQSASGTAAFVNGYLMSYPTTSDISLRIILDGTVPPGTGMNVTILRVSELGTSGMPVPGSGLNVVTPRISPSPGSVTIPQMTETTRPAAIPAPTQSGSLPVAGLIATGVAAAGYGYSRSRR
ncbi:MAG: hypothetical protein ABFC78_02305 [Methanoregula sp.]